ncbi:unnamed protein product [Fraxinus pennsylvanica]|uniref:Uncharacterized protein n=1 Tax=Fraxinus pennsylvanica TaxID=56036 RepID=A0AAD2AF82_9LAMI|nr:unnamed protein product [Fraxinus pennsylvanica]
MHTTEILYVDYNKPSPVAFVPIASSLVPNVPSSVGSKHRMSSSDYVGQHPIPNTHKLHLSVTLTLAESEYNRKLAIFQVRVESMSARSKVLASSSYPTMLQIKSQPIQLIETMLKTVPLRAEFQAGSCVPEIYTASLDIESELPGLKRAIWNWRRTIFVWISISSFMGELIVVLLVCRPIILPRGRSKGFGSEKKFQQKNFHGIKEIKWRIFKKDNL